MAQDTISPPPTRGTVDELDESGNPVRITRVWTTFFDRVFLICFAQSQAGTTAQRPTVGLYVGRRYMDLTLNQPIWYTAGGWRDATGMLV